MQKTFPVRTLALILAAVVCLSISVSADSLNTGHANDYFEPYAESAESFTTEEARCYIGDPELCYDITLGFVNGITDIPYISLETAAELLTNAFTAYGQEAYQMSVGRLDGTDTVMMIRENDSAMLADFAAGTITFVDINFFAADPGAVTGLDLVGSGMSGDQQLITHQRSFYKSGANLVIDLNHYGILPVFQDGIGYLPLQVFSDLISSRGGLLMLYNGQDVIITGSIIYPDDAEEAEEKTLSDIYYSGKKQPKSEALSIFTYNELCLALDYGYGLQEEHGIDSFNQLFTDAGLSHRLHSQDAGDVYSALAHLCGEYFADSHSTVNAISYRTEVNPNAPEILGLLFNNDMFINSLYYTISRDNAYPNGVPGYEEVGNTAYITFDEFAMDYGKDYYNIELTPNTADTIELILYANSQICRKDSPIRNVVLDLSNNSGGDVDAAVAVISWMLGPQTGLDVKDPISGAQAITSYAFDANLNGEHAAAEDSLFAYRLFCLTGSSSFSCGNLVPSVLAASGRAMLIGRPTGGGACAVYQLSTADGNVFQISGPNRLSTVKNGSYYSVDRGTDPHIFIADLRHLYDRQYLTDLINNLP